MLVDRITKETTDISRDFLDMNWWLDPGETITKIVSQQVIQGMSGWSEAPYPPPGGPNPYDPFPLAIQSAVITPDGTQLEVFVNEGSAGLAYTCQFVLDGSSTRRVTIELGVQVTGVPLGAPGSGPLPSYLAVTIADTPPSQPQCGQLWFDSVGAQLYIYYCDPTSSEWVIATANVGGLTTDAPSDGYTYMRRNSAWTSQFNVTHQAKPLLILDTDNVTNAVPLAPMGPNTILALQGQTNDNTTIQLTSLGGAPVITGKATGGFVGGAMVATTLNRNLIALEGGGYDGAQYAGASAFISTAAEAWTPSAHGAYWNWVVTPKGSLAEIQAMALTSAGALVLGKQTSEGMLDGAVNGLAITPGATAATPISFATGSGGAQFTGPLTLAGNAAQPLQAVPLQQIDALVVNVLSHGAKGDGVTDDTGAIQNVLNTYAGKAIILVPNAGNAYMVSGLTLPSGTDLLLYGTILLLANSPAAAVAVNNASSVTIRGNGIIDGNKAAQATHPGGMAGLSVYGANNVKVSGITLQNAYNWNLNVVGSSTKVLVAGVTMLGGGNANEFAQGSSDCWLTNCVIDGTGMADYAFCFYGGVTNSGAIGNTVKNAGATTGTPPPGIGVLSDSAQPTACSNIVIADNIIHGCAGSGISCISPGGNAQTGVVIANNRCYNNCIGGGTAINAIADICLDGSTGVTVVGNQVSANGAVVSGGATQFFGVYVGANASYVAVFSNQIYNIGQGTTSSAGVALASAANVFVNSNYIYDTQTTHTMGAAIYGSAGPGCVFTNNWCGTVPIAINAASDTLLANAVGGVWTVGGNSGKPGVMALSGPAGSNRNIIFETQAHPRWFVGTDTLAEGGSNAGTNFSITNVADNGTTLLGTPLSINRATGVVTLAVAPTLGALPVNAANDAAAAAAGVPPNGVYRNGSVMMVRVV
jgi:hypothetical protein